jgi:hypothetical protein
MLRYDKKTASGAISTLTDYLPVFTGKLKRTPTVFQLHQQLLLSPLETGKSKPYNQ